MDPFRVEPVDGLVEHHGLRVTDQRRGDPEPLPHAERELARSLSRHILKTDEVDQIVDPGTRNAVRLREGEQMVVGGAAGMHRSRLEQRTNLVKRRNVVAIALPVDSGLTRRWCVEPQDQPHRCRLPRSVRPEEPRHDARPDGEVEPIDGPLVAVILRQRPGNNHGFDPPIIICAPLVRIDEEGRRGRSFMTPT